MPRSSSGPRRRHFEIICDRDSRDVVPVLEQMVARWRKAGAKDAAALKGAMHRPRRRDPREVARESLRSAIPEEPEKADLLEPRRAR